MILWMDGPDHYGTQFQLLTQGPYAAAPNIQLVANSGPGGVGTVFGGSTDSLSASLRKVLPGNRALVGIGMRIFLPHGLPNSQASLMSWQDSSNNIIASLGLTSTGALVVNCNGQTFQTNPIIVGQSWQHIECRLNFSGANGGYAIGVNSLPIASADGLDFGGVDCAQVGWFNSSGTNMVFRDIYVWDDQGDFNNSGMQGDRQVITSMPTGDGPEQQWAPISGAQGFPMIDSVPPVDTNFVYANEAGQKSSFDMADIDTDITSISAVMLVARASKSDAGLGTMALNMNSDGSTGAGVEQGLSTEFIYYSQMFETDPHTSVKWIPEGVNAAQPELDRVQ